MDMPGDTSSSKGVPSHQKTETRTLGVRHHNDDFIYINIFRQVEAPMAAANSSHASRE